MEYTDDSLSPSPPHQEGFATRSETRSTIPSPPPSPPQYIDPALIHQSLPTAVISSSELGHYQQQLDAFWAPLTASSSSSSLGLSLLPDTSVPTSTQISDPTQVPTPGPSMPQVRSSSAEPGSSQTRSSLGPPAAVRQTRSKERKKPSRERKGSEVPQHVWKVEVPPDPSPPAASSQSSFALDDTKNMQCRCGISTQKLRRHWNHSCPDNPNLTSFLCEICDLSFTRSDNYRRHLGNFHSN